MTEDEDTIVDIFKADIKKATDTQELMQARLEYFCARQHNEIGDAELAYLETCFEDRRADLIDDRPDTPTRYYLEILDACKPPQQLETHATFALGDLALLYAGTFDMIALAERYNKRFLEIARNAES